MRDATYFTRPVHEWQRRYEALRASLVERLPDHIVAERFKYTPGYLRILRHRFRHGKIDFSEPVAEGSKQRRRVSAEVRKRIRECRESRLSAGEITELLAEEGIELSVSTVERVLAEEGFPKLPRRARLRLGETVKGAEVPDRSQKMLIEDLDGQTFESPGAGIFLFAPFLSQLSIGKVVKAARLPGTKVIPATSYLLSFLAMKLLGTERYSHVSDHGLDRGLGAFAGLNVLPKCTSMSTYSFGLDEQHIQRLQHAFVKQGMRLGLYDGKVVNLDFHTIPHYGEEAVLGKHWAGARGKRMKGALTLFGQDAESKLMLYTAADIVRGEVNDQVVHFLSFWKRVARGVKPTFVLDSGMTTYAKLSELERQNIKFITLRRRGKKLIKSVEEMTGWKRIHIPHAKRKYPNPEVVEMTIRVKGYEGELRQIVIRGNGHEKPTFLITNDFETDVALLVGNYARRWRVENGLAEAVKFFNLNALSSPILVKVHFDVAMTMIADTVYSMLAQRLRGFEDCNAPKVFRHFVRGGGTVAVRGKTLTVNYRRRAHNPILRGVEWDKLPMAVPGIPGARLELRFQ